MAKVIVDTSKLHFGDYAKKVERAGQAALEEAATVGVHAARSKPSKYHLDPIQQSVRAGQVHHTARGLGVVIAATDFRSLWFERGTYQRLGRVLSKRSKAGAAGNRGVKPQRFMAKARREGGRALYAALRRHL